MVLYINQRIRRGKKWKKNHNPRPRNSKTLRPSPFSGCMWSQKKKIEQKSEKRRRSSEVEVFGDDNKIPFKFDDKFWPLVACQGLWGLSLQVKCLGFPAAFLLPFPIFFFFFLASYGANFGGLTLQLISNLGAWLMPCQNLAKIHRPLYLIYIRVAFICCWSKCVKIWQRKFGSAICGIFWMGRGSAY